MGDQRGNVSSSTSLNGASVFFFKLVHSLRFVSTNISSLWETTHKTESKTRSLFLFFFFFRKIGKKHSSFWSLRTLIKARVDEVEFISSRLDSSQLTRSRSHLCELSSEKFKQLGYLKRRKEESCVGLIQFFSSAYLLFIVARDSSMFLRFHLKKKFNISFEWIIQNE